jgi:hypothetical protein
MSSATGGADDIVNDWAEPFAFSLTTQDTDDQTKLPLSENRDFRTEQ